MVVRDDTLCCYTFSLLGVMGVWILGHTVVTLFDYILSSSATLEYRALCVFTTVSRIYKTLKTPTSPSPSIPYILTFTLTLCANCVYQ